MQRYGWVIGLRPEKAEEYKKLHANAWPEALKVAHDTGMRNYSIYAHEMDDGSMYLFSYFEYVGDDFEADMAQAAATPISQEWWALCKPCQIPLENRKEGEWWATMEEVFHLD